MLKINLRNEIYQMKRERVLSYMKSLKASGATPQISEEQTYVILTQLNGKPLMVEKVKLSEYPPEKAEAFWNRPETYGTFRAFAFLARRITQIVRPNVKP